MPTLRFAIRFMLVTPVRKSEFVLAMWGEIDFDAAVWTIPKERIRCLRGASNARKAAWLR